MDYYKVNQYRVCLKYGQYEQMVTQSPWIRTVNPLWLQLFLATNIQVRVSTAEMVRHRNELFLGRCKLYYVHVKSSTASESDSQVQTLVCVRERTNKLLGMLLCYSGLKCFYSFELILGWHGTQKLYPQKWCVVCIWLMNTYSYGVFC